MSEGTKIDYMRGRIRSLGVAPGILAPEPLNAITDRAGVRIGHVTLIEGEAIRTGVTAILPHEEQRNRGTEEQRNRGTEEQQRKASVLLFFCSSVLLLNDGHTQTSSDH